MHYKSWFKKHITELIFFFFLNAVGINLLLKKHIICIDTWLSLSQWLVSREYLNITVDLHMKCILG